jgi:hypothetical protein
MVDTISLRDREYLGDAVYVGHDGFNVWLTTEDGVSITNQIALDPEVWKRLLKWRQTIDRRAPKGESNGQS